MVKLAVTKQKDHDEGKPLWFTKLIVGAGGEDDSCVLIPTQVMDSRFTRERQVEEEVLESMMKDPTFPSDRARGEELGKRLGISESAAQSRIYRKRDMMNREAGCNTETGEVLESASVVI